MSALYNSPVLYDQSSAIVHSFSLKTNKRKSVMIFDQGGWDMVNSFLQSFEHPPYDLYYVNDNRQNQLGIPEPVMCIADLESKLPSILQQQKIGTQLYISAKWSSAERIFSAAIEAGFTEEEIQVSIEGHRERNAFCPKCYSLSAIQVEDKESCCPNCGIMLVISDHFSKVRKGYLGYPYAKQEG